MILLIDNYDSFVYNLARYLNELGQATLVMRNDRATVADVRTLNPAAVLISPGPCTPREAGISVPLIHELSASIPMLGVCLGHQAIAAAFGGRVVCAPEPVHGRVSLVHHRECDLFSELPNPLQATRYHSLMIDEATLHDDLLVTARTAGGLPMAIAHRERPLYGVQFHPESVLTAGGHRLLANFLLCAGLSVDALPAGDVGPAAEKPDGPRERTLSGRPLSW